MQRDWYLAAAESLTGGLLSASVAQGDEARRWYRGGIVAYQRVIKERLLCVSAGQLVSEQCATEMAAGVARLMDSDVGIAVTGVGGPDPDEGQDAGTVWIAVSTPERNYTELCTLECQPPEEICSLSCIRPVNLAVYAMTN